MSAVSDDPRAAAEAEYLRLDRELIAATARFIKLGAPTRDEIAAQELRVATIRARQDALFERMSDR